MCKEPIRSDIELLHLLLYNIHFLSTGLCRLVVYLYSDDLISHAEMERLNVLITANKSKNDAMYFPYFWIPGWKQPRIEFINMLIQKYGNPYNS